MAKSIDDAMAAMIANDEKNTGKPLASRGLRPGMIARAMGKAVTVLLLAWTFGSAAVAADSPERVLVKTAVIKAPVEEVWMAWTTTEGIKSFFAPGARIEARPGGPFEVHFNPYAKPGMKGADGMVFLALQEKKMLSFTWNAPPHLAEVRGQRTSVTLRMKPAGEGLTEVRLVHGGWGEGGQWDQAFAYFDKAWTSVLENLGKRFREGPIDWTDWLAQVKTWQDAEDAKAAGAKKP